MVNLCESIKIQSKVNTYIEREFWCEKKCFQHYSKSLLSTFQIYKRIMTIQFFYGIKSAATPFEVSEYMKQNAIRTTQKNSIAHATLARSYVCSATHLSCHRQSSSTFTCLALPTHQSSFFHTHKLHLPQPCHMMHQKITTEHHNYHLIPHRMLSVSS